MARKLYALIGRLAYLLAFPAIWLFLRRSHRAYGLIIYKNKVLVLKGWLSTGDWHLPGGGIKAAESPAEAVRREVAEELGVQIDAGTLTKVSEGVWRTRKLGYPYQVLATKLTKAPSLQSRKLEIIDAQWLNPGELDSSNAPAEVLAAVSAVKRLNLLQ